MSGCKGHYFDGSECNRLVINGTEYCIFHHPNKDDSLIPIFEEKFSEEIMNQQESHPDYFDFAEFTFPSDIIFPFIFPTTHFNKAKFKKEVRFMNKNFR